MAEIVVKIVPGPETAVAGVCGYCGRQVVSYLMMEFADRADDECPYCGALWRRPRVIEKIERA